MNITNFFLLGLSILLETAKNVFLNHFSKNNLQHATGIFKFNSFNYISSFLVLLCFGKSEFSLFSIMLAFLFALCVTLNQVFLIKALSLGSMSFTNFILTSSLVIPTFIGAIIWSEKISLFQIAMLLVLISSMALALNVKKSKANGVWLLFCFLAMVTAGAIGVIQTIHQISPHSEERISFLQLTFLFSAIMNLSLWRVGEKSKPAGFRFKSKGTVLAVLSGAFMGVVHMINLYLSGVLPKVIFFPVVNGSVLFMTLLCAVVFFKEKLHRLQWLGIVCGSLALCLIGL